MSSATVTSRLQALEESLGVILFDRHKGIKIAEPTPAGETLYPIARNMAALHNECTLLRTKGSRQLIRIATADSFFKYVFAPAYQQFIADSQSHCLDIKIYPSDTLYDLVGKREVDLGLALYDINHPDVVATPLFSDDAVVVVPKNDPRPEGSVSASELDPRFELFIGSAENRFSGWGPEFNAWHDKCFGLEYAPLVRGATISVILNFLELERFWVLLPRTIANELIKEKGLRILELSEPAPRRTCYFLTHRAPTKTARQNAELIKARLMQYVKDTF